MAHFLTVPNFLTALRLLLIPVIWVFALNRDARSIGVALLVAFITDALDGPLAKWLNQITEVGALMDSLSDQLLILSSLGWLAILRPRLFVEHPFGCILAVGSYLAALLIGLTKHKRLGSPHLYSSRLAGTLQYAFIIQTFLFSESYDPLLFYIMAGLFTLSSIETLYLYLTRSRVDEHIGTVLQFPLHHAHTANQS